MLRVWYENSFSLTAVEKFRETLTKRLLFSKFRKDGRAARSRRFIFAYCSFLFYHCAVQREKEVQTKQQLKQAKL